MLLSADCMGLDTFNCHALKYGSDNYIAHKQVQLVSWYPDSLKCINVMPCYHCTIKKEQSYVRLFLSWSSLETAQIVKHREAKMKSQKDAVNAAKEFK